MNLSLVLFVVLALGQADSQPRLWYAASEPVGVSFSSPTTHQVLARAVQAERHQ